MKSQNLLNLVLGTVLTITAVGCNGPQNPKRIPGRPIPVEDPGSLERNRQVQLPPPIIDNQTPPNPEGNHDGWVPRPELLQAQTIYFDFDRSAVRKSEQAKLEDVANFLKGNPVAAVRVEGNCDERGTEEYNRSLGERRALAAREYLVRLGIDPRRIDTISYGEDKPVDPGHNEAAWSKNRRDDFTVLVPPKP